MENNLMGSCHCEKCTGKYCAKKVYIFSTLQEEQLEEISSNVINRRYKKGQMIFFEGDVSDKLYIVNKGKVKIFKYTKEGKEQILYILTDGDFVGELSLLKKTKVEFNAEALEDTAICALTKENFDKIIEKNPEITFKILEVVHDRLINLENLVQRLSTKDVESRVSGVLLSLAKDFGKEEGNIITVNLPLNREEIGSYAGLTRETVSRTLTGMQDEGIIELHGNKKIIIKDIDYLKSID
ncbi:Crp/Fnr family transcriptional regulator [Clostridium sp. PL3]|uniref:Crp/Fnr family transcriptional regulator n=1 Tax=Clostridium thailandense TaxID=2794346 RepID=A0A949TJA7_9CLOT|nr:Crp/Fnr family transcriptional regulator [Clostridium thailandense]MBV7273879.1 Crp/Fnr family transcriptional regulator [Clostridium thailandense]